MGFNLAHFALEDMAECGSHIRNLGNETQPTVVTAEHIVRYLHRSFTDDDGPQISLARFFLTADFQDLSPALQAVAQEQTETSLSARVKCLTLLANAGQEPVWNEAHRAMACPSIPLTSTESVHQLPMISLLVNQLGLELDFLVRPNTDLVLDREKQVYNVLYVPEAANSPHLPAQDEFILPYGIRSVLGFGGVLPTGNIYAVILFSRTFVPEATATLFKTVALNVKMAILPTLTTPLFAS